MRKTKEKDANLFDKIMWAEQQKNAKIEENQRKYEEKLERERIKEKEHLERL